MLKNHHALFGVFLLPFLLVLPISLHGSVNLSTKKSYNIAYIGSGFILSCLFVYLLRCDKTKGSAQKDDEECYQKSEIKMVFTVNKEQKLETYEETLDKNELMKFMKSIEVLQEDNNKFIRFGLQEDEDNIFCYYAENVKFFYGLCDEYEQNLGWACAWRMIQSVLSSYNLFYTFGSLYERYRQNKGDQKECAEPGYGKLALNDLGISAEVFLYNCTEGTKKTPSVDGSIPTFDAFVLKLVNHFTQYKTPVMIDDISHAYAIFGIKKLPSNNVVLWMADAHKKSKSEGLYCLELNAHDGTRLDCTGVDCCSLTGFVCTVDSQRLDMKQGRRGWLMLFPQE